MELYLSTFVLFFHISRWKGDMKTISATAGPSVGMVAFVITLWMWIQVAIHQRIEVGRWTIGAAAAGLAAMNYHFLMVRAAGPAFERHFRGFPKPKKILLLLAAATIFIGIFVWVFLTVPVYQRAFNIHPIRP